MGCFFGDPGCASGTVFHRLKLSSMIFVACIVDWLSVNRAMWPALMDITPNLATTPDA
jgi:hypothetical protein